MKLVLTLCLAATFFAMTAFAAETAPAPASSGVSLRKIIPYGGGWKDHQVQEPVILVNPKDPSRLILFFAGSMKPGGMIGSLAKAWAFRSDPFTWHEDSENPLMVGEPEGVFDESSYIRLDTVLYQKDTDEYWIYYTGNGTRAKGDGIGLAICPAGKDGYSEVRRANIRRHPGNPILSPKGQGRDDETYVSQSAIVRENGVWHAFYSYRTATQTLPGVRLATSRDGKTWSKQPGPDLFSAAPESQYCEWHQVLKIGDWNVILFEAYNGGSRWRANVAVSRELTRGWKKLPATLIDQTTWPQYAEDSMYHLATPALYRLDDRWLMYFQAASSGFYIRQHWNLWATPADSIVAAIQRAAREAP